MKHKLGPRRVTHPPGNGSLGRKPENAEKDMEEVEGSVGINHMYL